MSDIIIKQNKSVHLKVVAKNKIQNEVYDLNYLSRLWLNHRDLFQVILKHRHM